MGDLVGRMPCGSLWETRCVFQGAGDAVCASTVPTASTGLGATSNASRVGPETMVAAKQPTGLGGNSGMLLKTILNRIQKHRGFVYGPTRLCEEGATLRLEVEIYPHLRNRPRCSGCQGRTKIRPQWRRKVRPSGRPVACLEMAVRAG